jgi:hypothetical protein
LTDKNVRKIDSTELRCRAEERLGDETATEQPLGTEGDPQKLRHELQVHQIELEMQNAELRQARDQLEEALEQYTDLYDFAPVGYLTLTVKELSAELTSRPLVSWVQIAPGWSVDALGA